MVCRPDCRQRTGIYPTVFLKHHFVRYTGVISGHKGPVYYYIPVLIIGLFPVDYLLAGRDQTCVQRKGSFESICTDMVWAVVSFFTFSTTKLPNYVLPAIPAAAIMIASGMSDPNIRWRKYSNICIAAISLSLAVTLLILKKYLLNVNVYDTDWTFMAAAIIFSLTILGIYAAFAKKTLYVPISCIMVLF